MLVALLSKHDDRAERPTTASAFATVRPGRSIVTRTHHRPCRPVRDQMPKGRAFDSIQREGHLEARLSDGSGKRDHAAPLR